MGAPTIKDVAALAGVSLGTASRVLTGHPSTSTRSRERVTAAAARLGYTVNARARSLRAARSDVVALLVPDVRNTFFAQLAHTVQAALFARGLTTIIGSASEDAEQQDGYLRVLLEQRIDGAILAPQGDAAPGLRTLVERRIPLVFVDRTITALDVPSIDSDPAPGLHAAVEELVDHGHRSVTYVAGLLGSPTGRERLAAFEQAAASSLAHGSARVIRAENTGAQWLDELDEHLRTGTTALVLGYSPHTLMAIRHLQDTGRRIGRDVSIISYDDLEVFDLLCPRLTVITQHPVRQAERAVDMLCEAIDGGRPDSERIAASLIRRDSVATLAPQS